MNSAAITLPEPPRGYPFGGGGVHRNGDFKSLDPHQHVYRDPGYPYRSAKSRFFEIFILVNAESPLMMFYFFHCAYICS